ncbi:MAG: MerR family transcriptional regulator [Clostridia bacterium]|nr:MerR family transcriptional regulator [Clostridia bacterium]
MRYLIGEIAKLNKISAQTLRYYDKIGLFRPNEIDEQTGYRYYGLNQFQRLQTIKYLKFLGFSLDEIKSYLDNPNPENTIMFLKTQSDIVDKKINQLNLIKQNVDNKVSIIKEYTSLENYHSVRLEEVGPLTVIGKDLGGRCINDDEWALELNQLLELSSNEIFLFTGDIGISIDKEDIINGDYYKFKTIFYVFSTDSEYDIENATIIPKQLCVRTLHKGSFNQTHKTYERLQVYIQQNHLEIVGDSFELSIIDYMIVENEDQLLVDISIPVKMKK